MVNPKSKWPNECEKEIIKLEKSDIYSRYGKNLMIVISDNSYSLDIGLRSR